VVVLDCGFRGVIIVLCSLLWFFFCFGLIILFLLFFLGGVIVFWVLLVGGLVLGG